MLVKSQNYYTTTSTEASIVDSDEEFSNSEEDEEQIHVTAKIDSVNAIGEMKIQFSENMFTAFNYSNINSSIIEIYIIPSQMRNEDNEEEVVSEKFERRRGL